MTSFLLSVLASFIGSYLALILVLYCHRELLDALYSSLPSFVPEEIQRWARERRRRRERREDRRREEERRRVREVEEFKAKWKPPQPAKEEL